VTEIRTAYKILEEKLQGHVGDMRAEKRLILKWISQIRGRKDGVCIGSG
jgi:hypothetical protein